jgi:citrate lyase subunit beta/citryl-CoA lyase
MAIRSWLFVPGDSEAKLGKVAGYGADAVVIDLEDAVAPAAKRRARQLAGEWLEAHGRPLGAGPPFERWVRINPVDGELWREDLAEIMAGRPDGIVVPKALGPDQLLPLAAELYEQEQRAGTPIGSTRILPMVGETPAAALSIPAYVGPPLPRLAGFTWGAEDLAAALGATRKRDDQGQWSDTLRFVRTQLLLAAHARGVMAVETQHDDFRNMATLKRIAADAYADGFTGMLAIHPAQVPVINAAFTPGPEAIARAQAIVAAFEDSPSAGALQIDGKMIELPHLEQARRLLESVR